MKLIQAISTALVVLAATSALAKPPTAPPPAAHPMAMTGEPGVMDDAMKARHAEMMAEHDRKMAKMTAMDAQLDELVTKMNAAADNRKVDAVAAVVTELVAQRKDMRQQMMAGPHDMMKHMMKHMPMETMKGMAECPMMKGMDGMSSPGKHDEHAGHLSK